jgi:hypothetical protein
MSWDDTDLDESEFCPCGVTLMGDPDEDDGLCGVCAGAPHGRECPCDECEAYWADVTERSRVAYEEYERSRARG